MTEVVAAVADDRSQRRRFSTGRSFGSWPKQMPARAGARSLSSPSSFITGSSCSKTRWHNRSRLREDAWPRGSATKRSARDRPSRVRTDPDAIAKRAFENRANDKRQGLPIYVPIRYATSSSS